MGERFRVGDRVINDAMPQIPRTPTDRPTLPQPLGGSSPDGFTTRPPPSSHFLSPTAPPPPNHDALINQARSYLAQNPPRAGMRPADAIHNQVKYYFVKQAYPGVKGIQHADALLQSDPTLGKAWGSFKQGSALYDRINQTLSGGQAPIARAPTRTPDAIPTSIVPQHQAFYDQVRQQARATALSHQDYRPLHQEIEQKFFAPDSNWERMNLDAQNDPRGAYGRLLAHKASLPSQASRSENDRIRNKIVSDAIDQLIAYHRLGAPTQR